MTTEHSSSNEKVVRPWDMVRDKDIQQLVFSYEMVLTEIRTHARGSRRGSALKEWVERLDTARDEFVRAMSDRPAVEPPAAPKKLLSDCATVLATAEGALRGVCDIIPSPTAGGMARDCREMRSRIEQEIRRASEPPSAWQSIDTRPKDLESTYLVTNGRQVAPWIRGVIHNNVGTAWDWDYGSNIIGWMPLPEPLRPAVTKASTLEERQRELPSDAKAVLYGRMRELYRRDTPDETTGDLPGGELLDVMAICDERDALRREVSQLRDQLENRNAN